MAADQPAWMGPYEGRELTLMLAGEKPLAMFGNAVQHRDLFPEADFAPMSQQGASCAAKRSFVPIMGST